MMQNASDNTTKYAPIENMLDGGAQAGETCTSGPGKACRAPSVAAGRSPKRERSHNPRLGAGKELLPEPRKIKGQAELHQQIP